MLKLTATTLITATAITGSVHAANFNWLGVDGDWNNGANWSTGAAPVDTASGNDLEIPSSDRLVFNLLPGIVAPSSNVPVFGGNPNNSNNDNTPQIDLLNGTLNISMPGFNNQGIAGVRGGTWSTTVGDGDTGNGLAALTLTGNFSQGIARDGSVFIFDVAEDGTLTMNGNGGGGALWFSYDTGRRVEVLLDGGHFVTPDPLQMLRNSADLGPSFFDLQAVGSSVTASFGVDFPDLATLDGAIGDGLTFRSTTGLTLERTVNATNNSFTVTAINAIPSPTAALTGLIGLGLVAARRRRHG